MTEWHPTDNRYRRANGGVVPLRPREKKQFLALYYDLDVPVDEIAGVFGIARSTVYAWLPKLWLEETRNGREQST